MKTLSFNLNSLKNGGKITAFNYSHSLNELAGSWRADVAGGTFDAGDDISFDNVMTNGIISKARKDSSGLWHVEGYDAGIRLMRSLPDIEDLPTGDAKTVIQYLADFCGISLNMTDNGLSGFNVRTLISGSTCAEAVLELAMLSGYVAFINSSGYLCVQSPSGRLAPIYNDVIDDSGSDFDLDGYATQATIILRKSSIQEQEEGTEPEEYYTGETPSTSPDTVSYSGSFSGGSYSMKMLEPFGVISELETTITENGLTITTEEEHTYDYKHKTIWRDNQEYVLFAFIETGYTLTKTIEGTYATENSGNLTFTEVTTETMTRTLSPFDAIGVPKDWQGELDMVDTETITRSTVRTGAPAPTENMPAYAPPFDSQIERKYSRGLRGKYLVCNETEKRYEARQIGVISQLRLREYIGSQLISDTPIDDDDDNPIPYFLKNEELAIPTHSIPKWVEVDTYRTIFEQYDSNGDCVVSVRSEYCDDGSKWLSANALTDTGDEDLNEYQKAYAKFSQNAHGLEVSLGSSAFTSPWHFIELQGRTKNTTGNDTDTTGLGNIDDWYENGEYKQLDICPHYNETTHTCNMAGESQEKNCVQGTRGMYLYWKNCSRALEALRLARLKEQNQLDTPIIGTASISGTTSNSPAVGYKREIFVEGDISDEQAQTIANTIAANILAVKGTKGLRKTVTIPYNANLELDGNIVEVSHDWENLTSTVTYRINGTIPDFLVAQSVSGIAAFVAERETSRLGAPKYGVVSAVNDSLLTVNLGNSSVKCTTKLKNLSTGDTVLVSFPSGNKFRGQIIARL